MIAVLGASFPVLYSVGQFHLEYLGIAFSLWGLLLIRKGGSWRHLVWSGILMGLGCFAKQVQVLPVFIALFWLLRFQRSKLIPFTIALVLVGLLGSLWIDLRFGDEAWRHLILYTVGTYSLKQLLLQFLAFFMPWILFFIAGILLGLSSKEGRRELTWWYFVGTSLGLISTIRMGSSDQYFIEWSFATLLWLGPGWAHGFRTEGNKKLLRKTWSYILIIQVMLADLVTGGLLLFEGKKLGRKVEQISSVCRYFPDAPIEVPTEAPGVVRHCGGRPALHPFIMTNLNHRGLWDESDFIKKIKKQDYPLMVLPFDPKQGLFGYHAERWTPQAVQAMARHYHIKANLGDFKILKPQSFPRGKESSEKEI